MQLAHTKAELHALTLKHTEKDNYNMVISAANHTNFSSSLYNQYALLSFIHDEEEEVTKQAKNSLKSGASSHFIFMINTTLDFIDVLNCCSSRCGARSSCNILYISINCSWDKNFSALIDVMQKLETEIQISCFLLFSIDIVIRQLVWSIVSQILSLNRLSFSLLISFFFKLSLS